ncbi:MAG TPA: AMP-binding protein, partial [Acidimicrobiales bacterium]|nr:AMP-binding protein [Acidimicrobiales bacterium]
MQLGFWALAQEDPHHLALVDPDGREIAAGDLLGEANRLARGLREAGLRPGDAVAAVLPNGTAMIELYLAV